MGPPLVMSRKESVPRKVRLAATELIMGDMSVSAKIPTLRKRRSLRKIRSVQAGWGTRQTWSNEANSFSSAQDSRHDAGITMAMN
jgi:hypothetical protein